MRLARVELNFGFIIDLDKKGMSKKAKEEIADIISEAVVANRIREFIYTVSDVHLKRPFQESDIPVFLREEP